MCSLNSIRYSGSVSKIVFVYGPECLRLKSNYKINREITLTVEPLLSCTKLFTTIVKIKQTLKTSWAVLGICLLHLD